MTKTPYRLLIARTAEDSDESLGERAFCEHQRASAEAGSNYLGFRISAEGFLFFFKEKPRYVEKIEKDEKAKAACCEACPGSV